MVGACRVVAHGGTGKSNNTATIDHIGHIRGMATWQPAVAFVAIYYVRACALPVLRCFFCAPSEGKMHGKSDRPC